MIQPATPLQAIMDMAIIDAAVNGGNFNGWNKLLELEKDQNDMVMRENAMHIKTMVSFDSINQEVPNDLNAFKRA